MNGHTNYINPEALKRENEYLKQRLIILEHFFDEALKDGRIITPPAPIVIQFSPEQQPQLQDLMDNQYKKRIDAAIAYIEDPHYAFEADYPHFTSEIIAILKGEPS